MRETSWGRVKYRTTNWKAYNAALKARGELTIWLDRDMQWLAQPTGKRGRCQKFSDAAIQFCQTIKCLFGQPLRQTLGLVESLLGMAGLDWPVPDYSTVCRRQKSLDVQVRYRASDKGLHMLADSTGIKFLGEGEWKTKKHGAQRRRQWRKVPASCTCQPSASSALRTKRLICGSSSTTKTVRVCIAIFRGPQRPAPSLQGPKRAKALAAPG